MANASVPLSESPGAFLDPDQWRKFCDGQGGIVGAIALLSMPEAHFMRSQIERALNEPAMAKKARRDLHAHDMRDRLLTDLRSRLGCGKLMATGISGQGVRIEIAPELWVGLEIDFAGNTASSKAHRFTHVQVRTGLSPSSDLLDACTAWLRDQPLGPKKETLREAAKLHLGKSLTQRVFNSAYAVAFARKVGRPDGPDK